MMKPEGVLKILSLDSAISIHTCDMIKCVLEKKNNKELSERQLMILNHAIKGKLKNDENRQINTRLLRKRFGNDRMLKGALSRVMYTCN